ncbi:protein phosphatase 2C-like domain-containing protein 1 [Echinops telfairi]|uniref:Protein phosphatase 2C-like domain-containing protein 1 n=1 Tax=Echinops telfairi TaxID=9371 RepID=A0ABM0ZQQ9_ECHTE|nr:protein phosphatase 2C-like domain-containing protein 1 [Echinops telfairi]
MKKDNVQFKYLQLIKWSHHHCCHHWTELCFNQHYHHYLHQHPYHQLHHHYRHHPHYHRNHLAKLEEQNVGKDKKQDGKEKTLLQITTKLNTALKVYWKSKAWKKKTLRSKNRTSIVTKRKRLRKRKKRLLDKDRDQKQASKRVITFPCSICNNELDLPSIFPHQRQHKALTSLGFHSLIEPKPQRPEFITQRNVLIMKLLSYSLFNEKALQSINDAFELLWKKSIPAYYKIMESIDMSSVYPENINHALVKGIATCEDRNSTWRATMDDKFTIVSNFGKKPNVCLFGLFDGHYGASAANLASVELPLLLLHQMSIFDPSYQMTPEEQKVINSFQTVFSEEYIKMENNFSSAQKRTKLLFSNYESIHKAFAKAYWRMDRLLHLGRKEESRVHWSGCSALTCLLEGKIKGRFTHWKRILGGGGSMDNTLLRQMPPLVSGVLHVANTGNVQGVLCRNGKGFCLTKDHTTQNVLERRRVLQMGATIDANEPTGLLEGQTKTTRGLGFHGNFKLKNSLIPAPQTISVPIDDLCQFLILATNGLWEVLDEKEVITLTMTILDTYKENYLTAQNKISSWKLSETSIMEPESSIYVLYQFKSFSKELVSAVTSKENSKNFEKSTCNLENLETSLPISTKHKPFTRKSTREQVSALGVKRESNKITEAQIDMFYESAAKYVSQELVNAALAAGSRDNITVMVILLSGSEYQLT